MSRVQTHVLNGIHTCDQKEFGLPFHSQWQIVQWDIHSLRKPGEMLTVAACSLFVAGQFSCPLAFQTALSHILTAANPLQVHAVEREKLSSLSLSVKASGRMQRDEAIILLCVLFQAEHLPEQEESVTILLPGHWSSGPEGQVSFESFLSFSPVHDWRPISFVSLSLGSPHSLSVLAQKACSVLLLFLCLFRAKARRR